ncbi:MAG: F0F1 ATP synthase subunit alpha, partial [Micrococcales bacterium]|nr:F0F1 ATP synthase subunit alpha [Micrococcales bacterium]
AMFASDLDAASRQQLARGARLMQLLKQPQYSPYPVEEQTVSIWAGTTGKLDEVPVEDVLRFESELLEHLRRNTGILTTIRETNKMEDETVSALEAEVLKFKKTFLTGVGKPLASVGNESVAAIAEEEVDQEKIVKQKR